MKTIFIISIILLILIFTFKYLLKQSKNPSGLVGIVMMRLWNNVYLPMSKWCLSFLERKEFDNVLDIGIGNGATTKYISDNFICKSIIGIDISNKAIEQAMNNHSKKNIIFEVKNITKTGYPSNQFDLICAFQNHFHWNDLKDSLSEIRRMLSINGIFIIGCEYSKIKYYLSDLKIEKDFDDYLNTLNLKLAQVESKKDWIFYKIMPN